MQLFAIYVQVFLGVFLAQNCRKIALLLYMLNYSKTPNFFQVIKKTHMRTVTFETPQTSDYTQSPD
jgi:hypothetical protein